MMCSVDDDVFLRLIWYDVFCGVERCGMWGMKNLVKEVEVLEKLKLAIFAVQAKSDPATFSSSKL
eukprot:scaffold28257_cov83-Skeletonema_marinoi.AAC.1